MKVWTKDEKVAREKDQDLEWPFPISFACLKVKHIPFIKSHFPSTTPGSLPWLPQTGLGTSPLRCHNTCPFYSIALTTLFCNGLFTCLCATLSTIKGRELVFDFYFWLIAGTLSILLNKRCRIWQGWLEREFGNIWDQILQNREVTLGPWILFLCLHNVFKIF